MITPRSSSLATSTGPGPTSSLTPQQLASWNDSSHKNEVAGIGLLVVVSIALSFCFFYVVRFQLPFCRPSSHSLFNRATDSMVFGTLSLFILTLTLTCGSRPIIFPTLKTSFGVPVTGFRVYLVLPLNLIRAMCTTTNLSTTPSLNLVPSLLILPESTHDSRPMPLQSNCPVRAYMRPHLKMIVPRLERRSVRLGCLKVTTLPHPPMLLPLRLIKPLSPLKCHKLTWRLFVSPRLKPLLVP